MNLGAQLYTMRNRCKTPEDLKSTMERLKKIGYDVAQASAICEIEPELLRSYIDEIGLPITCTHTAFSKIKDNVEEVIRFHKIIGCPVIGIGSMPGEYRESLKTLKKLKEDLAEPLKKIEAAGLHFAYHNHDFEFEMLGGVKIYDFLIEELPTIHFIHDVYWSTYADEDPKKYIELFGKSGRMTDIHFKDMISEPKGAICPCGDGIINFAELAELCKKYGIENVHVEQDNAPSLGDEFEQMQRSLKHLAPMM